MIAELLQREFLLDRAKKAAAIPEFEMDSEEKAQLESLLASEGISEEEWAEALQLLSSGRDAELEKEPEDHDGRSYFARDPYVGLLQSALLEFYEEQRPELIAKTTPGAGAAEGEVAVTDQHLEGVEEPGDKRELFEKFSKTDIGWASVLFATAVRTARKRHPFNDNPAEPYPIAPNARVVLVSDWGTGIPRARKVGQQIRAVLDQGKGEREQHVVHLGDVYYSGFKREYKKNFLRHWPVLKDEADEITSWCLNANHDMYAGGKAYFEHLLSDPRFKHQQSSSFFKLFNDKWQLLGLDTAYEEHGLHDPQGLWVKSQLETAPADQKCILMSHHQLFDKDDSDGEKLAEKLEPALSQDLIYSWFWGHEHRCTVFKEHMHVKKPRLIGHGGVPVYAHRGDLWDHVEYEYRDSFDVGLEEWAYFGFVVLDFDNGAINVRYVNEDGVEHYREDL